MDALFWKLNPDREHPSRLGGWAGEVGLCHYLMPSAWICAEDQGGLGGADAPFVHPPQAPHSALPRPGRTGLSAGREARGSSP